MKRHPDCDVCNGRRCWLVFCFPHARELLTAVRTERAVSVNTKPVSVNAAPVSVNAAPVSVNDVASTEYFEDDLLADLAGDDDAS